MITCTPCDNNKPLGTEGNGPAYAYGREWLCEVHMKEIDRIHYDKVSAACTEAENHRKTLARQAITKAQISGSVI